MQLINCDVYNWFFENYWWRFFLGLDFLLIINLSPQTSVLYSEFREYSQKVSFYGLLIVKYKNNEIQIEAERNIEPVNRLTERFFSL